MRWEAYSVFMKQIFIEHLVCTGTVWCAENREVGKKGKNPCSHGAYIVVEKIDIKQINRKHNVWYWSMLWRKITQGVWRKNNWERGDILDKTVWEDISEDMTCKETPEMKWWCTRTTDHYRSGVFAEQMDLGPGAQVQRWALGRTPVARLAWVRSQERFIPFWGEHVVTGAGRLLELVVKEVILWFHLFSLWSGRQYDQWWRSCGEWRRKGC